MSLHVGTSGWQYKDWRGVLYPEGVPQRLWLERYAECFATVESNNAFYRLPPTETFQKWRDRTPDPFVMAVKASRYLTHIKRLTDPAEPVARLMRSVSGLAGKLGPILLQLPPNLQADAARLHACLRCFPPGTRVAVEPRHESWWTDEVRAVLTTHDATLCWADRRGRPWNPLWRTAGWAYLRFHEGAASPWPSYGETSLRSWLRRVEDQWPKTADVYAYFNNDQRGAAVHDASRFRDIADAGGWPVR
ncbi:MAG: DUF72 domain-containing protein [Streptosporangiales bacterium]|nr:DUF72 domain-containing protein [Streptosporangiales bacterium]MBO0891910.1 DUF72 domain-containing protein [Acidothermales bacterium]